MKSWSMHAGERDRNPADMKEGKPEGLEIEETHRDSKRHEMDTKV